MPSVNRTTRTPQESGFLAAMSRAAARLNTRPTPMTGVMERQHTSLGTPYAQREGMRRALESFRRVEALVQGLSRQQAEVFPPPPAEPKSFVVPEDEEV